MTKRLNVVVPEDHTRREAVEVFDALLRNETKESDWQRFFDMYPFVLSDTLTVKFDGLYSQMPLVTGRPDYVFHRSLGSGLIGDYGVIELKRPDQSIVGAYSSRIIRPSQALVTAQEEVKQHLKAIRGGQFVNPDDFFMVGNRQHAFIIIGTTENITSRCRDEILRRQFADFMPPGFNLYTYDEVFRLFAASVPPRVQVLMVTLPELDILEVTQELIVVVPLGLCGRPSASIVRTVLQFESDVYLQRSSHRVNAKSIMGLLTLAAPQDTRLLITARGRDALEAISAVCGAPAHMGPDYHGPVFRYSSPPSARRLAGDAVTR